MSEVKLFIKQQVRPVLRDLVRHHQETWRELAKQYIASEEDESNPKLSKKDFFLMKRLCGYPEGVPDKSGNVTYDGPIRWGPKGYSKTYCGSLETYEDKLHDRKAIENTWECFKTEIQ
eukprot:SAG11_NODE_24602_length_370_cov_97.346863_1_plen_117_part_01